MAVDDGAEIVEAIYRLLQELNANIGTMVTRALVTASLEPDDEKAQWVFGTIRKAALTQEEELFSTDAYITYLQNLVDVADATGQDESARRIGLIALYFMDHAKHLQLVLDALKLRDLFQGLRQNSSLN